MKGYSGQATNSVVESKELKVFVRELQPGIVNINDSVSINIHASYIEHVFYRKDSIEISEKMKLVIFATTGDFFFKHENKTFNWYLDGFSESGSDTISNAFKLVSSSLTNEMLLQDTITIKVIGLYPNIDSSKYNIHKEIGRFYLIDRIDYFLPFNLSY